MALKLYIFLQPLNTRLSLPFSHFFHFLGIIHSLRHDVCCWFCSPKSCRSLGNACVPHVILSVQPLNTIHIEWFSHLHVTLHTWNKSMDLWQTLYISKCEAFEEKKKTWKSALICLSCIILFRDRSINFLGWLSVCVLSSLLHLTVLLYMKWIKCVSVRFRVKNVWSWALFFCFKNTF